MKVLYIKLKERIKEFLLYDYNLKLIGICEKDNTILFNGEDYFVTKIKLNKENEIFFRISMSLIDSILTNILGPRENGFSTESISELEAKILTELNDFIYKGISPFFIKNQSKEENINCNHVHITFVTKDKNDNLGKLILSIPVMILPISQSPVNNVGPFNIGSFPKYKSYVKIISGKSDLTLYEIQHIEVGDIVVLEKSNIKMMTIDILGHQKDFAINPDTSIITGIEDGGESMENNVTTGSINMWDIIPVEITAEFDKVAITLGELKQISEGVIVDVGTIYENKIYLKVENKPIAKGELIIINDKYAVRVDEVFTDAPKQEQQAAQPVPTPQRQNSVPQQQKANQQEESSKVQQQNGDDFNYDNFDIEDEDI